MVKQAAHNSSDECSNHSGLNISVLLFLAFKNLAKKKKCFFFVSSSAEIGRQGKIKIFWLYVVNVQVVPWVFMIVTIYKKVS